ncbi:MAG: DEAD/DEAH box helicase, partial [Halieaceae bacterium]|nr:DEAD/DEAH box helicase [Halieaceae bacterium]
MSFNNLGLIEPIARAVSEKGYTTPSPIQAKSIPVVLQGKDLMASAQTGTGKTAAFVLPLLQQLASGPRPGAKNVRALIVTPTRELAAQIQANIDEYSTHLRLSNLVVFGGVNIRPQIRTLQRGVDILVATPGRLLDLHGQHAVNLGEVDILVLDEADRMLDMGFIHDIRRIQKLLPKKKQSLLFSATFSSEIRQLAKTMLHQPVEVDVAPRNTTVETVSQRIHPVDKGRKSALLQHLILDNQWQQVLVFSRTKHGANKLVKTLLKADIPAVAIHGNKSQAHRTRALADFKAGKVDVMVATDIAARGIDIADLPHVINFDLPNVPEDYVHRIGRTGRAGAEGEAISLVSADEIKQLRDIERLIQSTLERDEIEGFEPEHHLP